MKRELIEATQEQLIIARNKLWTSELDKLLRKWRLMIGIREKGHNHQTRKFSRRHYIFGGPSIILSSISSVGIFATFRNCDDCDDQGSPVCEADQWIRLVAGIVIMISTALTAFLTFMNYSDIASDHKAAADDFGALYRKIENLQTVPRELRGDPLAVLQDMRNTFDDLVRRSPMLPERYDVSLNYEVVENIKLPKPPPKPVNTNVADLKKLIKDDEEHSSSSALTLEEIEDRLAQQNQYDTEDENQEVKIMLDLEDYASCNATAAAIAAAQLAARKEKEKQDSLQAALIFEMGRLDGHAASSQTRITGIQKMKRPEPDISNSRNDSAVISPKSKRKVQKKEESEEEIDDNGDIEVEI